MMVHQASCAIYTHSVCDCWPDFSPTKKERLGRRQAKTATTISQPYKKKKKPSRTGRRKRSRMIKLAQLQGGWHCHYCKKSLTPIFDPDIRVSAKDPSRPTIDHVHPVSKGGPTYNIKNQVLACAECNEEKGDTYEQD